MYILKLLLSIVTAGIEALVISGNKFCISMSKKSATCELSHVLYCETLKGLRRAMQNKRCGMLTSGLCSSVAMCVHIHLLTLEHCWNIWTGSFDHPPHSPDLTSKSYHLFTYLKNWLGSQCCWKLSNHGWAHRQQTSFRQAYQNLFPDTSASIPALITLGSSLSMYIYYVYNKMFSHCLFCKQLTRGHFPNSPWIMNITGAKFHSHCLTWMKFMLYIVTLPAKLEMPNLY
jgi:hypothetical protein